MELKLSEQERYFFTNRERLLYGELVDVSPTIYIPKPTTNELMKSETNTSFRSGTNTSTSNLKPLPKSNLKISSSDLSSNTTELSQDTMDKANMVEACKIAYKEDYTSAQEYLDTRGIKYTINRDLSNADSLVLSNGSKTVIAYRGTDLTNTRDMNLNKNIIFNNEASDPKMNIARAQVRAVINQTGSPPEELVGFSQGGNMAINMANEFKIPSTTFNPFLNGRLTVTGDNGGLNNVFVTTTDPASILSTLGTFKNLKSVNPLKESIDPVDQHANTNFTSNGSRTQPKNLPEEDVYNAASTASKSMYGNLSVPGLTFGIGSSVLGNLLVKRLDPEQKLSRTGDDAVSGAIGGGIAKALGNLKNGIPLSSAGLFSEAVTGSAGFIVSDIVGSQTNKALIKAGANKETADIVSNTTAGAAGAVTTVVGSIAAGAEIGTALAPETLGASVAIGAAIGAAVGTGQAIWGDRKVIMSDIVQDANKTVNFVKNTANTVENIAANTEKNVGRFFGKLFG